MTYRFKIKIYEFNQILKIHWAIELTWLTFTEMVNYLTKVTATGISWRRQK